MLSKGLVAPVVVGSVGLLYLAARHRLARLDWRQLAGALLAFLLLVLPWHLAAAALDPGYLRELYVSQQWERVVDAGHSLHARSALFYVPVLLAGFLPWSVLLPASLLATLRRERRGPPELLCALWAGLVLLLFSLAQGKLAPYILPALPPLALLTARHLERVLWGGDAPRERRLTRAGLWVGTVLLVLTPLVAIGMAVTMYDHIFVRLSLTSLLVLPAAAALALLLRRGRLGTAVLATAATAMSLLLLFVLFVAPRLADLTSLQFVARAIAAAPGEESAPLVAFHVRASALSFYLGRPVLLLDRPGQLRALLAEHALVFVVTSPEHVPQLVASGPFVPWRVGPRRALYASQPPPPNLDSLDRPTS
jgi:4-amino-4-deoxy-L-arabinose transferase-like glycosyltransferase